MFSVTAMFNFVVTAFRSASATVFTLLEFEYQQNLYYIFMKLIEEGLVPLMLNGRTDSEIENDVEAALSTIRNSTSHGSSLPPATCFTHEHTKAPYTRAVQFLPSPSRRISAIRMCHSDATSNVVLYPSVMQVRLGYKYKYKSAPCSTPIQGPSVKMSAADADMIVRGAIDVLNALVAGVDQNWPETPVDSQSTSRISFKDLINGIKLLSAPKMTRSLAQFNFPTRDGPAASKKPASTSAPRMTRSYAHFVDPAPTHSVIRRKETFETSEHNKNRLRATLARTKSLYAPGSYVRPSGQAPDSQARTIIHGLDGALNVALYPKSMLVKLKTFEGDDMTDSSVCDPEETVRGAIERLDALVDGLGYDCVHEPGTVVAYRMQRGGSRESVDSNATASSGPHPTTPRDELCFSEMFGKD